MAQIRPVNEVLDGQSFYSAESQQMHLDSFLFPIINHGDDKSVTEADPAGSKPVVRDPAFFPTRRAPPKPACYCQVRSQSLESSVLRHLFSTGRSSFLATLKQRFAATITILITLSRT